MTTPEGMKMPGGSANRAWPVGALEWEARAREIMGPEHFDWVAGGAGEELTLEANRQAFRNRRFLPRVLTGVARRDTSIEILKTPSSGPFLLAPIGAQTLLHPDGELAVARAAARTGVPMILAQAASHSMEDVAREMGEAARWYQLYWVDDREIVHSLVDRAVKAGYGAIVLTVDTPILGLRDRDARRTYSPFTMGHGIAQYTSDPVFRSRLRRPPEEDPRSAGETMARIFSNPSLQWKDLVWLRDRVELPLLIKGIIRPDDALRSMDAGFDGIVVSNHGGRQVDGVIASLDALAEVRRAVGDDVLLLVDGGIRRGTDVVKALCLGADAVLLGRPYVYGLAVAGQEGVEHVIRGMIAEVDNVLALIGAASPSDLDSSLVVEDRPR